MIPPDRPMSPRVLIIEPYADLRSEIAATLTRAHYTCDAVASAEHARLALDRHAYKYVLMEEETIGGELVSSLDPRSHVILITESDSDAVTGADSILQKPFSRDELIARFAS
jgi:DNA-binding response OmpR family regulator